MVLTCEQAVGAERGRGSQQGMQTKVIHARLVALIASSYISEHAFLLCLEEAQPRSFSFLLAYAPAGTIALIAEENTHESWFSLFN